MSANVSGMDVPGRPINIPDLAAEAEKHGRLPLLDAAAAVVHGPRRWYCVSRDAILPVWGGASRGCPDQENAHHRCCWVALVAVEDPTA